MLPDDADDLLGTVTDFIRFHKKLGEAWANARNSLPQTYAVKAGLTAAARGEKTATPEFPLYVVMPSELVDLLDELGGVVRCEEENCRKPCHSDWDFCEEHGKK